MRYRTLEEDTPMYTGLLHSHSGLAYLLLLSTTVSLGLALLSLAMPRPGIQRFALLLAKIVEPASGGLLLLVGLGLWAHSPWPWTTWWMWVGFAVLVASPILLKRGIRPAIEASLDQAPSRQRWAGLAATHWFLIVAAFGLMHAKP